MPLTVGQLKPPSVAAKGKQKTLYALLTVKNHVKLRRRVFHAYALARVIVRAVDHAPKRLCQLPCRIVRPDLPSQERSERPSAYQRINKHDDLVRLPDIRPLKIWDKQSGILAIARHREQFFENAVLIAIDCRHRCPPPAGSANNPSIACHGPSGQNEFLARRLLRHAELASAQVSAVSAPTVDLIASRVRTYCGKVLAEISACAAIKHDFS